MKKFLNIVGKISKWLVPAACLLILFALLTEPSLAKVPTTSTTETKTFLINFKQLGSTISGIFATVGSVIIVIIVFLSFLMALALGNLMDSTFILDSGMGDTLYLIWTVVRNFVNVGFILLLLIMAAMVVLGLGDEGGTGTLKKVLPKFVISLVAVNLTFFGARVILTVNDVLATAIFSLPRVVSGDKHIRMPCMSQADDPQGRTCEQQIAATLKRKFENVDRDGVWTSIVGAEDTLFRETWASHTIKSFVSRKNMSLVLLTNMADIEHVIFTRGQIGSGSDLTVSIIGGMIMAGAVGFIFTILALAFVVRMVVLWIVIAFSPVAALGIVIKELFGFDMGGGDLDPLEIFMTHAFMSTMVAIPLSVGMIMIFANNAISYGDFSFQNLFTLSELGGTGFALIWWFAAVAIVWFGTKKVTEKSTFVSNVTGSFFEHIGKAVGDIVDLWKFMPILPKIGSINNLLTAPSLAQTKLQASNAPARENLAKGIASLVPGYQETAMSTSTITQNITNIKETEKPKKQKAFFEKYEKGVEAKLDLSSEAERTLKEWTKKTFPRAAGEIESAKTHRELLNAIKDKYEDAQDKIKHIFNLASQQGVKKKDDKDKISKHEGNTVTKGKDNKLKDSSGKEYTKKKELSKDKNGDPVVILKSTKDGKEYYATKTKDKDEYTIMMGKDEVSEGIEKIGDAESENEQQAMTFIKKLPETEAKKNKKGIRDQLLQRLDSGDIKAKEVDNWERFLTKKEELGYELLTKKEFEETIERSGKFKKEGDVWRPKSV